MAVRYLTWDGEEFSWSWYWVFRAAVADGVLKITDVNDGHRSMALQQQRVDQYGLWSTSNPTGAARPSATAPHIRVGREDHANDVQTWAVGRLIAWLAKHGVRAHTPIAAEPWHVEVLDEQELVRFGHRCYSRLRAPLFTERERVLMHRKLTRRVRLMLKAQARLVQLAARKPRRAGGGWDRYDREKRFRALRARALS